MPSDYEEVDLPDFGGRNDSGSDGSNSDSDGDRDDDNGEQETGSSGGGEETTMAGVITNIVEKGNIGLPLYLSFEPMIALMLKELLAFL